MRDTTIGIGLLGINKVAHIKEGKIVNFFYEKIATKPRLGCFLEEQIISLLEQELPYLNSVQ